MQNRTQLLSITTILLALCACSSGGGGGGSSLNTTPTATPPPPLLEEYVLSSDNFVPSNIAFDPVDRAFYAASRNGNEDGSIIRIDADGTESIFHEADGRTPDVEGAVVEGGIGGIAVDAEARWLWACANNVDGLDHRVWVFDLASSEMIMEFLLGAIYPGGHCNDLVLDEQGVAYVSDSLNPVAYRLDPDTELGEVYVLDPLLDDVSGRGFGSNGIEIIDNGNTLVIGVMFPPQFVTVSLPEPDVIDVLELDGDEIPFPHLGIRSFEEDLYVLSPSAVSRLRLNDDHSAAEVTTREHDEQTSSAEEAEGALYLVHSEVVNFRAGQELRLPFRIFGFDTDVFDEQE